MVGSGSRDFRQAGFHLACKLLVYGCHFTAQNTMHTIPAENPHSMVGTWKLVSYVVEVQQNGEVIKVMGDEPTGYATFQPDGRVFFMLTAEGRKPTHTSEGHAMLLDTMVAYTGTYRIEDDRWITQVQVAWNPEWIGTEQTRFFRLDGNGLQVLTPWRLMPNWADRGMTRSIISFKRAE